MSAPEARAPEAHAPEQLPEELRKGPIAWMAQRSVASNLLMFALLFGGLLMSTRVKQEVFPEFTLDIVTIAVPYPGASPEEVEQGITTLVEEAVGGLDGVKKVKSSSKEGAAAVRVELLDGVDANKVLTDIKAAVDRIPNLPVDAERPVTSLVSARNVAMTVVIHGPHDHETLRQVAEVVRDDLIKDPNITLVELKGAPPREIAVEVSQEQLRAHGLSLSGVAQAIRRSSIDLPGGGLRTSSGETLVRTTERRDLGAEFGEVVLKGSPLGGQLTVGDVAQIRDDFQEVDISSTFNGENAVTLDVYQVGEQGPIEVADAVKRYLAETRPPGDIQISIWNDRSQMFAERADLLKRNAISGLILVFVTLALFLELKLAFWVMLGIPVSIFGAFLLIPTMDVSINMISMFAFLLTLGIVVDDAIVVGEEVYDKRTEGVPPLRAAILGVKGVGSPVIFSVLTTVAAFIPLFFVPGGSGKFMRNIPAIVISVLLVSLIESLFVLPAHLAHSAPTSGRGPLGWLQRLFGASLEWFVRALYRPTLSFCLRYRYFSFAAAVGALILSVGTIAGGQLKFTFMPRLEGDNVIASARLPVGAPLSETLKVQAQLLKTLDEVLAPHKATSGGSISLGVMAQTGASMTQMGPNPGAAEAGSYITDVSVRLVSMDQRAVTASEIARRWRAANADLVGVRTLTFGASLGSIGGAPVDIMLSHRDPQTIEEASAALTARLGRLAGVSDLQDGFATGKAQLNIELKPAALRLGLTEQEVARQVRDAFFGAEALRQQRGRDEVRVMVRLPRADRERMESLERLVLRTPQGGDVPLSEVATLAADRAFSEIQREEARRVVHVTADVDEKVANANEVIARVGKELMPQLLLDYPGLTYSFEGQQREQGNTLASLKVGFILALLMIFTLLAIPLDSYLQPAVIMLAIPFGLIGAISGHLLLGYDLSFISVMGIIALAGVAVNDSLVLVVAINELRATGLSTYDAVVRAGTRRFRPILLTSLTTFMGLMPMIFEPSVQARFLVPMAVSLGFGVMFSTALILLVVPAVYLILDDALAAAGWLGRRLGGRGAAEA